MKSAANQQTRRRGTGPSGKFTGASWNGRRIKETSKLAKVEKTYIALFAKMSNLEFREGQRVLVVRKVLVTYRQTASRGKKTLRPSKLEPPGESQARKFIEDANSRWTFRKFQFLRRFFQQCWLVLNHSIFRWLLLRNLQQTNLCLLCLVGCLTKVWKKTKAPADSKSGLW